jgi:hypothetical protein
MFGVLALVPVSQTQSTGLPWWVWLLLLVAVILLFIWWQRRSDVKKAPAAEVKAPEPGPAVEAPPLPTAAAVAPVVGAEALETVGAPARDAAAEAIAVEQPPAEGAAAATLPKPPTRPWKSSTWRTREWQPKPPTWYPRLKYRRPTDG